MANSAMAMDLRHLRAFVAVYEEGGISPAAARLHVAQPSVSILIRDLERELDKNLFVREPRGVRPTPAADILFPYCQEILGGLERARTAIGAEQQRVAGALNVGLAPTITKGVLPGLLQHFVVSYPQVDIRIAEAFSGTLMEWILSGDVDFAIVTVPAKDRRLTTRRLAREPFVLVSGAAAGRPHLAPARLQDGQALNLVLPSQRHSLRHLIDWQITSGSIPVARSLEIDGLFGMLEFVRRSDWVTLLPVTAIIDNVAGGRGDLVVQPVEDALPAIDFYLAHRLHQALSRAAVLFIEGIEAGLARCAAQWRDTLAGGV